ncbi:MAG: tyrosine--tRNA ligase, partial [Candidatus Margulisiibacteriota bacterium]
MAEKTLEEKFKLITKNLEECLVEEDLRWLLENNVPLKHYIGFEISGKLHIGSGLMSALKIKDFQEAGVECTIFLADWHTWLNDKLGGNLQTIKEVAVNYFKEALRASLLCVGGDPDKVKFVLGSDLYHHNDAYWQTLMDVSKNLTLARVVKSSTIMGRKEGENQIFARLIYPPMQVADIFVQGINLAHAGLDQRKAHVIAREVAGSLKISPLKFKEKIYKPVALHHHLILGLGKPPSWPIERKNLREIWSEMKMSKSKPQSCVFIHDQPEEIEAKINRAFCPEGEIEF